MTITTGARSAGTLGAWSQTFPATPDQVGHARRRLASMLDGHPVAHDAVLCLSEVVTNAVQHSNSARPGGAFTIRAHITDSRLRVEVDDDGGPWTPRPADGGERSRGLLIVGLLADTFAVHGGETARTVAFELEMPHDAQACPIAAQDTPAAHDGPAGVAASVVSGGGL